MARCGNQKTGFIEILLRRNYDRISSFESDPVLGCIEIY